MATVDRMALALDLSQPSGQIAITIAEFMARPARHLSAGVIEKLLSGINGFDLRGLRDVPEMSPLIEEYLAENCGTARLPADLDTLKSLGTHAPTQRAIALALAPWAHIDRLKRFVVGAVCQKEIKGALLKADRAAIQALLGVDVHTFASRKAAVFFPALASLAAADGNILPHKETTEFSKHPVNALAGDVVAAALAGASPLGAAILRIRQTGDPTFLHGIDLTEAQMREVMHLSDTEAAT